MKQVTLKYKILLNQKGQALFEMILFLPFLLFLYTIYYSCGNAINGSINQQKAVRGYFYNWVKGNSYLVTKAELKLFSDNGIKRVGFNSIGWKDKFVNQKNAIAPCFKFSSLLKNGSTETCDSDQREDPESSRFIRLFTFYGVCGPHYSQSSSAGDVYYDIRPGEQVQVASCTLSN